VLQIGEGARHWFRGNLSAPLLVGDVVAALSDEGVLRAYSASDPERRLWTARVGPNQSPKLIAVGDRVVVTASELVGLRLATGKEVWSAPVTDAYFGVTDDPTRVVAISRTNGSLAVVDTRDGNLVADFALHDAPPGAVLHDGTLVWTGSGGVVSTARVP